MLLQDIREIKTGLVELRKFGLWVGGVFAGIALLYLLRHRPIYPWFLTPGIGLMFFGLIAPRLLKYIYLVWMTLAMVMGFVVSHVILTLFFFLVITPIGFAARLAGKDFLSLKLDRTAPSYWVTRNSSGPKDPLDYERQF
jgi:hypothetical protein